MQISVNLGPAWSTKQVPGEPRIHRENLSQKEKQNKTTATKKHMLFPSTPMPGACHQTCLSVSQVYSCAGGGRGSCIDAGNDQDSPPPSNSSAPHTSPFWCPSLGPHSSERVSGWTTSDPPASTSQVLGLECQDCFVQARMALYQCSNTSCSLHPCYLPTNGWC